MKIQSLPPSGREMGRTGRGGPDWFVVVMLSGIAAYLYLRLFRLPHTPFLMGGDQTYAWMYAQRMLYGERPYRDFFQFNPPGTGLVFFTVFMLFGLRIWVTNAVILILGIALCGVCFRVAMRIMNRGPALLATLLFLTLIYGRTLNATHHWFSMLLVMCAAAMAMREITALRILATGALLGASSFFTQTHGAAALLAFMTWLLWERSRTQMPWRKFGEYQGLLVGGFVVTLLVLSGFFIATVGFKQLWYFQVTYPREFVVPGHDTGFLGMPEAPTWRRLPSLAGYFFVYTLLPLIYPLALVRCGRTQWDRSFQPREVGLLSLVGLFLLVEVCFSVNWLRVYAVSMPGIVLLLYAIGRTGKMRRYALALVWVGIVGLGLHQAWARYHLRAVIDQLPGGMADATPQTYEKLQWVMQHTRPGEFFLESNGPTLYLPLQLRNPVFLDGIGANDASRPEYVELAVRQLETKRVRYILWTTRLDSPEEPARPWTDHLAPLRAYLRDRYVRVQIFSDQQEIWERKQSAGGND